MRIISDFKDYYDCIQSYGQSDDIVWVRNTKKFDVEINIPKLRRHIGNKYVIGFCGKVYPCFTLNVGYEQYEYIYKVEDLIEYAKKESRQFALFSSFEEKSYRRYFDEITQKEDSYKWVFEKYNVPVFLYYEHPWKNTTTLTINPFLRKFEFFRIKDCHTTFQDIQMFMGSLAKPEKPLPQMSDLVKIGSHGFNGESFRKGKKLKGGLK